MEPSLSPDERRVLLDVAEEAIRAVLEDRPSQRPDDVPGTLDRPGASFVTLELGGELLGCIGSVEPVRPLVDDVAHNAVGAAFADPRLPAASADEFEAMTIKVSVLGDSHPVPAGSLEELVTHLSPGADGLMLHAGARRATFLPSVWAHVTEPDEFVRMLLRKAGLAPSPWPARVGASTYRTEEFAAAGPRPPISSRS